MTRHMYKLRLLVLHNLKASWIRQGQVKVPPGYILYMSELPYRTTVRVGWKKARSGALSSFSKIPATPSSEYAASASVCSTTSST